VESSIWTVLRVSNCSTVTITEVGCGPLLIGYRQHRSASDRKLDMLLDHPRDLDLPTILTRMVD